jgi:hypothetical protein
MGATTEIDRVLRELGFEDEKEFNRLVSSVNLTSGNRRLLFKQWQQDDGTKKGLLHVMEVCNGDNRSCPCTYVEPCSSNCSCANSVMSGGCSRCCSYGSIEQRMNAAKRLAKIIDEGNERLRQDASMD